MAFGMPHHVDDDFSSSESEGSPDIDPVILRAIGLTSNTQPNVKPENLRVEDDLLAERRARHENLAEREIAKWKEHCEANPDEWELLWGALRDVRSDRMRKGFWAGVPEGLTGRKFQSQRWTSIGTHLVENGTSQKPHPVEHRSCVRRTTSTVPKVKKLGVEKDILRTITSGPSIQKKSLKSRKSKNLDHGQDVPEKLLNGLKSY